MTSTPTVSPERIVELPHAVQVLERSRFQFGANWARFLELLDEERIQEAESSLQTMLERSDLTGLSFLDAGSGSGLFSLAARRLGARVTSFDFDPRSVACTTELRRRYFPEDANWEVLEGSVLDNDFVQSLGSYDVVYSWGVLHHTGAMWRGIEITQSAVKVDGQYFIALYNDQGMRSVVWRGLKRTYCSGVFGRVAVTSICYPYFIWRNFVSDAVRGINPRTRYAEYHRQRGMSVLRDWVDWLGGYPFEVATPTATFNYLRARGFRIDRLQTTLGSGCNEFVLRRESIPPTS